MDENAHPTKQNPEPPTPEVDELVRLLEIQAAAQRNRRGATPKGLQGVSFRLGSLIVIVVFALGSIGVMEWMISQLPKPESRDAVVAPAAPIEAAQPAIPAPSAIPAASARSGSPAMVSRAGGQPKD
jgi:hypothetical protein